MKVEKSIREMYADNYKTKQSCTAVEDNVNLKVNEVLREMTLVKDS